MKSNFYQKLCLPAMDATFELNSITEDNWKKNVTCISIQSLFQQTAVSRVYRVEIEWLHTD